MSRTAAFGAGRSELVPSLLRMYGTGKVMGVDGRASEAVQLSRHATHMSLSHATTHQLLLHLRFN